MVQVWGKRLKLYADEKKSALLSLFVWRIYIYIYTEDNYNI